MRSVDIILCVDSFNEIIFYPASLFPAPILLLDNAVFFHIAEQTPNPGFRPIRKRNDRGFAFF